MSRCDYPGRFDKNTVFMGEFELFSDNHAPWIMVKTVRIKGN